jgi:hypothetical protein
MINLKFAIEYPFTRISFNHIFCRSWNTFLKHKHFELEVYQDCDNLLHFHFNWTTRCDHAGVKLELGLFGYELIFNLYDSRHWNCKTNTWEVYD